METFANNAVGNLNAAITLVGATSFVLQAGQGALFPAAGNFRVVIDSEIMIVGARSGDTCSSVTRGAEGTAAATHLIAAPVTHEVTAAMLGIISAGQQIDYVEVTADATATATSAATATAVITSSAVSYDGSTAIWIEFQAQQVFHSVANSVVAFELYDGASDIVSLAIAISPSTANGATVRGRRKITPSNASHTYSVRMWSTIAGTSTMKAATAAASQAPAYLQITKA